ncbi:MAG: diheme cytochrome c [Hyphomicrobiaceae bacterium]
MKRLTLFTLSLTMAALAAQASRSEAEGIRLPPVTHAATLKECSACHMVFPPQFLPERSWTALMAGLDDHFGENAGLDDATRADITAFLAANAADVPGTPNQRRLMRGIGAGDTPLRITDTPYWRRGHHELSERRFKSDRVKSKANCMACHRTADRGEFYEEDD